MKTFDERDRELEWNTIRDLRHLPWVSKAQHSATRIVELVAKNGDIVWVREYWGRSAYGKKMGTIFAKADKNSTYYMYEPNNLACRRASNRISPIEMWTYSRKIRVGIKVSEYYHLETPWDKSPKWAATIKRPHPGWNPFGDFFVTGHMFTITADAKIKFGLERYVPKPVGPKKPLPKPRSTITVEQFLLTMPLLNKINMIIQDKRLGELIEIRRWWTCFGFRYNGNMREVANILYPHLRVSYPKMTKRNIRECIRAYRNDHSVWDTLEKKIILDNPFIKEDPK